MIRVNVMEEPFNTAYWDAKRTLPVEHLETPRQYGQRWRREFRCRVDPDSPPGKFGAAYYIFDRDADYTWFMLKYS